MPAQYTKTGDVKNVLSHISSDTCINYLAGNASTQLQCDYYGVQK